MNENSSVVDFANEVKQQSTGESMYTLVYNEATGQFEHELRSTVNESSKTPYDIAEKIWA